MTWAEFKEAIERYARLGQKHRSQFLFRGQASLNWPVQTTLDRHRSFISDASRRDYVDVLLAEFEREAVLVHGSPRPVPRGDALALLARHHGLWSPLLDWTSSPYIASYFAFHDDEPADDPCVWVLDRSSIPSSILISVEVDLIDDRSLLQFNPRALQQRGVFLKINTVRAPVEALLAPALSRFELRRTDRSIAFAELDAMNLNASTLFDDLDGAAQAVKDRIG